jgi:Bacterial Ig-like domain (group 3)
VVPQGAYTFNAPNLTLATSATNSNPMAGERAFSGSDGGKVTTKWGTSVVDLAAAGVHAGDVVQLRFDMGRDCASGIFGWYVDNVSVTVCKQATAISAAHTPDPSKFGTASGVRVNVARKGTTGAAPSGTVKLVDKTGATVSSGQLVDGTAVLPLAADFPAGTTTLTARYAGTDVLAPVETPVLVNVTKGSVKLISQTIIRKPRPAPSYKEDFRIRAKVTASGQVPSGKVVIKRNGKVIGQGVLSGGKVKITIKENLKVGTHKLLAKYLGSATTQPSKHAFKIRIVKK